MNTNIVVFYKVNVPYSMDDAVIEVYGGDWVFRRNVTVESGERDRSIRLNVTGGSGRT